MVPWDARSRLRVTLSAVRGATNAVDAKEREAAKQRVMKENIHKMKVPRRPPWTSDMSAEELDTREREYFLHWRRDLAACAPGRRAITSSLRT